MQQRRAGAAAAGLPSNKKPRFRIVNSPAVDPDAASAAAGLKRRLLMGTVQRSRPQAARNRDHRCVASLLYLMTMRFADVDDVEQELSTPPRLRSLAGQSHDLDTDTLEGLTKPQPQPDADARQHTVADRSAASAASHRTPATSYGLPHGANSRHALLARLATTPRPGLARLKSQPRPLVRRVLPQCCHRSVQIFLLDFE